ncbi:MAG: tRNA guanosine(34) transglycosylase Tgt [Fidelibacterota bacterium]
MNFQINSADEKTSARFGVVKTDHSIIATPAFMPIGTQGAVKTIDPQVLGLLDFNIILGNTYHLYLRPGASAVQKAGGLHQFMGWNRSILTDSGGYQVFSLARLNRIQNEGVEFQSHLDGSRHFLSPETSMKIQRELGADIIMAFDECPPGNADHKTLFGAVKRTALWVKRCHEYLHSVPPLFQWNQTLFPIVQGGIFPELRVQSVEAVLSYASCGVAIGGLAVGEEKTAMFEIIALLDTLLPKDQPRYLMGVGRPTDLVRSVQYGVDMFDCVLPTRNARNGQLFTSHGIVNIGNEKYKTDFNPVDNQCQCYGCEHFTRAYLRHLFNIKEVLGLRLATIHNLTYFSTLMKKIRDTINAGTFNSWSSSYLTDMENFPGM